MNHGVDVGTDVTAWKRRATQKLKEREENGKKKANRVSVLARIDGRCKTMGRTGVMPTSTYGSSAVGADEGNIKRQKRNLAIATGIRRSFIAFLPERSTKYQKTPKASAKARKTKTLQGRNQSLPTRGRSDANDVGKE